MTDSFRPNTGVLTDIFVKHWQEMTANSIRNRTKNGAKDVNQPDPFLDRTPLHWAICYTNDIELVEVVRLLLEAGANINAKDQKTRTPLDYAMERKEKLPHEANELNKVIELLEEALKKANN